MNPGVFSVRNNRVVFVAMLFVRQGRHAEAEQACRRFLRGAPGAAGLLYYLADACHGQGQDEEARAVLDSLLQRHPRHVDALVLRAILYGEAERDDQAIVLLRRALTQDPSHRLARSHLIQALARAGHAEEARHERDRMLREAAAVGEGLSECLIALVLVTEELVHVVGVDVERAAE